MQELSLFGQVSQARHEQVLSIFAGIAAMPPVPVLERHIVYKPLKEPVRSERQLGASQEIIDPQKAARNAQKNTDLFFLTVKEDWLAGQHMDRESNDSQNGNGSKDDHMDIDQTPSQTAKPMRSATSLPLNEEESETHWRLQYYDVPLPGKRPVTSRMSLTTEFTGGNPAVHMQAMGYRFVHHYLLHGQLLIYNNIVLLLYRMLALPETLNQKESISAPSRPSPNVLPALDASGTWIVHAFVRVEDSSKQEDVAQGTNELLKFKDMLKNCLDLRVIDRLALDTRIK